MSRFYVYLKEKRSARILVDALDSPHAIRIVKRMQNAGEIPEDKFKSKGVMVVGTEDAMGVCTEVAEKVTQNV